MYRSEARAIAQSWSAPNVDFNFTEPLNNAAESVAEAVVPEVINQNASNMVRNVVAPTTSTVANVAGSSGINYKQISAILATSAFIATAYNVYKNPEILSNIKVLLSAPKKTKKKSKKKSRCKYLIIYYIYIFNINFIIYWKCIEIINYTKHYYN